MTSKRQQLPGYVRKQTKRGLWNVRRRSLSSQINCTMAHLKPHRGVTLWRITQQREERGGGHLMLLMSKLGARVKLRFATENMESPFFLFLLLLFKAWKERMMKSPVLPSCRETESARMWSGTAFCERLCLRASAREGGRLQTVHLHHEPDLDNHFSSSRGRRRHSRVRTPSPLCTLTDDSGGEKVSGLFI